MPRGLNADGSLTSYAHITLPGHCSLQMIVHCFRLVPRALSRVLGSEEKGFRRARTAPRRWSSTPNVGGAAYFSASCAHMSLYVVRYEHVYLKDGEEALRQRI